MAKFIIYRKHRMNFESRTVTPLINQFQLLAKYDKYNSVNKDTII